MTTDEPEERERELEDKARRELHEEEAVPVPLQGIEGVGEHSGGGVGSDPGAGPLSGREEL